MFIALDTSWIFAILSIFDAWFVFTSNINLDYKFRIDFELIYEFFENFMSHYQVVFLIIGVYYSYGMIKAPYHIQSS